MLCCTTDADCQKLLTLNNDLQRHAATAQLHFALHSGMHLPSRSLVERRHRHGGHFVTPLKHCMIHLSMDQAFQRIYP